MVFNATFNNSSAISWRSVLLVEETRVPGENYRQNFFTYSCIEKGIITYTFGPSWLHGSWIYNYMCN